MSLYTLVIDFLQKKIENPSYTEIQTFLVNNSGKSRQKRQIVYGVNQGTMYEYYRLMKKIRDQKSHATVPLRK